MPDLTLEQYQDEERNLRARLADSFSRELALADERDKLRERLAKLEAACRPFAEFARWFDKSYPDGCLIDCRDADYLPTVGELRALAALIEE